MKTSSFVTALAVVLLLSSGCARGELQGNARQAAQARLQQRLEVLADSTESALQKRLGSAAPAYVGARENLWPEARRFYEQRNYDLAWVEGNGLTRPAEAFVEGLCRAGDDGLAPSAYQPERLQEALRAVLDVRRPEPSAMVELDLLLTHLFMRYSYDMVNGRLDPADTRAEVHMQPAPVALDSVLALARAETSFERLNEALRPRHGQYDRLRSALGRYRQIEAEGGWPTLPAAAALEPGRSSPEVPLLRARLAATADLGAYDPEDTTHVFDDELARALAAFQRRHGLEVDTLVGAATLAALNVGVAERIEQIMLNLERWRWLPADLGSRYILVNIPDFTLAAYEQGEEVLSMPVVVGAEYDGRETPVFSDRMEYVIFQPYWNVPSSIALEELLPKAREDPSYLERNGYEIIDSYAPDAEVVEIDDESLEAVAEERYRLRQQPGRSNALGHVKFIFPNEHSIYLHDTPADHLFDEIVRDYSHGCIRVERPADLAAYALAKNEEKWTPEEIEQALQGEREVVVLDQQIPVYIMYLSAFVGEDGAMHFRDDIYGYDADLAEALREHEARIRGNQEEGICEVL